MRLDLDVPFYSLISLSLHNFSFFVYDCLSSFGLFKLFLRFHFMLFIGILDMPLCIIFLMININVHIINFSAYLELI